MMSRLRDLFDADMDSVDVSIQTNQYRGESPAPAAAPEENTFYLQLVSVAAPETGPRVRVWRETYF